MLVWFWFFYKRHQLTVNSIIYIRYWYYYETNLLFELNSRKRRELPMEWKYLDHQINGLVSFKFFWEALSNY